VVAAAFLALGFAHGGYGPEAVAAAAIVIWWTIGVGLVVRAWPRERVPMPAVRAGLCLAGLGTWTALSLLWTDDAGRTFTEIVRVGGYVGLFVCVVIAARTGSARRWLVGLTAGLVILAGAALASRVLPSLLGGPDRALAAALPTTAGRLSYPIGYWNGLGACMAIGVTLLAWFAADLRSRGERAIATGLLPALGLVLVLTSSRGGILAAAAGLAVVVILAPRTRDVLVGVALGVAGSAVLTVPANELSGFREAATGSTGELHGAGMGLAIVAVCVVAGLLADPARRRASNLQLPRVGRNGAIGIAIVGIAAAAIVATVVHSSDVPSTSGHPSASLTSGRADLWSAALHAFGSDPVTGIGAGGYGLWWNAHATTSMVAQNAHSLYLETLAELGVVGLALLLGFAWFCIRGTGTLVRSPETAATPALAVLAAGATSAAMDWTWQVPAAFAPVILAAALLAGPACRGAGEAARAPLIRSRSRLALGIATAVVGAGVLWASAVLLISSVRLAESRDSQADGRLTEAAVNAQDAATIEPWSADPRVQLASVELQSGHLDAAEAAALHAIENSRGDYRGWLVLAEAQERLGMDSSARAAFVRARSLSPRPLPVELLGPSE
jgi:hypothetical protein